jgi:hypothetical protein
MATFKAYDTISQDGDYSDDDAREWARGFAWCECEVTEQAIGHARHIDTIDEIGIYYDYAADYYFFTDESPE